MEPALKQRLLGAAVIVALAIIIIPFLLDGSGTEPVSDVPLPPEPQHAQQGPLVTDTTVPAPATEPQSQVIDQYSPPPTTPEPTQSEPAQSEPTQPEPAPVAPAQPSVAEPAPPAPQAAPPVPAPTTAPAPAPPAPAPQAKAEPQAPAAMATPSAEELTHAWAVQVGSFSQRDKALALRDRLRKQHFKAFVEEFKSTKGQSLYRVRVGPVPERPEAEKLQQTLETQEKLKGFVTLQP